MQGRIDLDRARRDAKTLLRAAREGDAEALGRMRPDREPRLADAQRAVARALGERSWPALVRRVEAEAAAEVDELVALALAGEHDAALELARARPAVAAQLRDGGGGGAALLRAAREGRAAAVYTLLELGVPANVRDPASGGTALHVAAALGLLDAVDVLVGWVPLDLHARDAAGDTALGACAAGSARADGGGGEHLLVAKVLVSVGLRPEPGMAARASGEVAAWLERLPVDDAARPAPSAEHGEAVWAAEAALFAYLARSPVAETRAAGDGVAFATGLQDNTRNGVVCSRLDAGTADERIAEVLAWLRERDGPAQWMVAATTDPPDLGARLERAGCSPERSAVHMAAALDGRDLADPRPPAGVTIAATADEEGLAAALAAAGALGDDPAARAREVALLASLGLGAERPLRHWAARRDGAPVGVASAFISGTTLLLTELAVAPAARRAGIGRALVLHALRAGRASGCALAVLGPTPATVPFYEALGFALERFPTDRCFYTPLP